MVIIEIKIKPIVRWALVFGSSNLMRVLSRQSSMSDRRDITARNFERFKVRVSAKARLADAAW